MYNDNSVHRELKLCMVLGSGAVWCVHVCVCVCVCAHAHVYTIFRFPPPPLNSLLACMGEGCLLRMLVYLYTVCGDAGHAGREC